MTSICAVCIIWGMKAVCLTGNRPHKMPFNENSEEGRALKQRILDAVTTLIGEGYEQFITGMALGSDIYFAECVLALKREHDITLEAAVPFDGQGKGFAAPDRERYKNVISHADKVTVLSPYYTQHCYFVRNRYMVDNSDVVLTVDYGKAGGTSSTVAYAKKNQKRIINLAE